MLGEKRYVPKLVYHFNLEARVPGEHLLRQVAAVVDFSFVRRLTARFYSHTGQPGIDPVVLFKMALLGYLYGITSERRLAEAIQLDLAFLWFIGYDIDERTPDHSVLSKARRRFGVTTYRAFFTEIVRQCEQAGLVQGNLLYVDSTLVKANASMASVGARTLVEQQLAGVDEHLSALWRDNPAVEPATSVEERPTNVVSLPTAAQPTATATTVAPVPAEESASANGDPARPACAGPHPLGPDDRPNGRQGGVNELAASRSDPDAGLVSRDDVPLALYHKAHVGVDGGAARIITAIEVTAGEVADEQLLDRVRKEHEGTTGRTVAEVVADTKYGTQENYQSLEEAGISPSIPPHDSWNHRALPRDAFSYEPGHDRFRCPQDQILARQGRSQTGGGASGGIIYRAAPKVCGACPLKATCCGDAKARTISRPDDEGLGERVRTYLRTGHAKTSIRRRKCWAESAMAELKERHGLRRARCRGRANVQIEALGAAIAYNVKKLARGHRQRLHAPAVVCSRLCAGRFHHGDVTSERLTGRHGRHRRARQVAAPVRCHRNSAT
jgi:transposase